MVLKEIYLHRVVIFFCLSVLLSLQRLNGQSISNEGTDFWVCFPSHVPAENTDGSQRLATMSVFITAKSNSSGKVTCGTWSVNFSVQANTVTEVLVPRTNSYIENGTGIKTNKGIRIIVDEGKPKVVAYAHVFAGARSAASLVLPVEALAQKYYAVSYTQLPDGNVSGYQYLSQFNVVAVDSNTVVKITPMLGGTKRESFSITLNHPGDVYQYQNTQDITGSLIEVDESVSACKKIAVFSGSTALFLHAPGCVPGNNNLSADPLFQQLYPIESWGKTFALIPFYDRRTGSIYRFMASEDNTEIIYNGTTITLNKAGDYHTTTPTYDISMVMSNKPITVTQYALTQYCADVRNQLQNGIVPSDPDMVILNPLEYSIDAITLYSSTKLEIREQYINVVIPSSKINSFTINNANYGNRFTAIPGSTEFSYAQINLNSIGGSNFSLAADTGFNAIAYGFGSFESYAYSAGTSLASTKTINALKQGTDIVAKDACLYDAFDFKLTLPYQALKLIWKIDTNEEFVMDDLTPIERLSGNKILYEYKLIANKMFSTSGVKRISIVAVPPPSVNLCYTADEDVINYDLEINSVPAADFSMPDTVCKGSVAQFTYLEQNIGKPVNSWEWDFGDGTTSTEKDPQHVYARAGKYKVKLVLKNMIGCASDVKEKEITVEEPFAIKWDVSSVQCREIHFRDLSVYNNNSANSWEWDFGDNTTSTEQHPVHTYQAGGTYNVRLIVGNSIGCKETYQQEIKIGDPAEIGFENEQSCVNDIVTFTSRTISGEVASWEWDFGDGSNDTTEKNKAQPNHKYAETGDYNVKLTAVSVDGCTTVFQKQITINSSNPTPLFEVLNANALCGNYPVQFKNNTTIPFGVITKLEWLFDYGNGQQVNITDTAPEEGKIYTHKYPESVQDKTYKVVLRAYSGATCYNETAPVDVLVKGVPSLYLNINRKICLDESPFRFDAGNQSALPGTEKIEGKGIENGIFYPANAGVGNHEITYTFMNSNGCTDTVKRSVQVVEIPELAEYKEFDILLEGEKKLGLKLQKGSNVKYQWYPSEGLSADNILNPVVSPKETTKYILTITSGDECIVTYEVKVNVHIDPFIPNAFSPNGDGYNDTWSIRYLETFPDAEIRIFNRYGQEVFYSKRYTDAWNGKYKGQDVPAGVYYYIIEPNNGRNKYTGSITLIR